MPKVNGPLLRRTRRIRDETAATVAKDVGIAEGSLRSIESMRVPASEQLAYRLAARLELDPDDVLKVPTAPKIRRGAA